MIIILFNINHNYSNNYFAQDGKTALHYACSSGNPDLVLPLLKLSRRPQFVNAVDSRGETGLHIATRKGFVAIMKLLRKNKADPKIKNRVSLHRFVDYFTVYSQ